jgi:dGTP triphosphohydrolase
MVTALLISIMINVLLAMILYYYADSIKSVKLDKEEEIIEIQQKAQQEAKKELELIAKENREFERLKLLAQESEYGIKKEMIAMQEKIQIVLIKLLEKHKACIESNYKTLQALQSKYIKAIDLQIARKTLSGKNRNKLIHRFEKLKKEITDEIKESEKTQEAIEKAFKEIEEKIHQTLDNRVL